MVLLLVKKWKGVSALEGGEGWTSGDRRGGKTNEGSPVLLLVERGQVQLSCFSQELNGYMRK